jgi:hypothetical protein
MSQETRGKGSPAIAVVIVTFDNPERLRRSLGALSGEAEGPDKAIIVNTGTMGLDWVKKEFPSLETEVLDFDNIGPAGGFREGGRRAFAEGFDYIIQADDDAVPSPGSLKLFRANARAGRLVVAGHYSTGAPIMHSNHYFMVHRSIYAKAGFYFSPFFFMNEDIEFPSRIAPFAELYNDPGIVIHHPFYPEMESQRHYYYLRNSLAHSSATGNIASFLLIQNFLLAKSMFCLFYFHSMDFLAAFSDAYLDFLSGRLGKSGKARRSLALPKAGSGPRGSEAVLLSGAMDPEKIAAGPLPKEVIRTEVFSGRIRYASLGRLVSGMLRLVWRLRGKDLFVVHPLLVAFPPFSLLAKSVYVHDEKENCFRLLYHNNALMRLLAIFTIIPAVALATVAGPVFFLLKGRAYGKMLDSSIAGDLEFCRRNAKAS